MNQNRSVIIRLGAIIFGVLLVIFLIVWLVNRGHNGTLVLKAATATTDVSVVIQRPDVKDNKITLKAGETKRISLPVGNVRVNASSGEISSADVVAIKGAKTTSISIPKGEQRDAKQLASSTRNCPFIVDGKSYDFACSVASTVNAYSVNAAYISTTTTLFGGQTFNQLTPYAQGLLGFRVDTGELVYLDVANQTITPVTLSEVVRGVFKQGTATIITPNDPATDAFALFFSATNQIYIFKNIADAAPVFVKSPKPAVTANFADSDKGLVLYSGTVTANDDINLETDETTTATKPKPVAAPYVYEYDLAGNLRSTIAMPKGMTAQAVYKIHTNYYLVQQPNTFQFYFYSGGKMSLMYSMSDVSSWTVYKDVAYFQANGRIYTFTPGDNGTFSFHSVFSSPNITVAQIQNDADGVSFSGITGSNELQRINVYQLLATKQGGGSPQVATTFKGFDTLLANGLSSAQLTDLKIAFSGYAAKVGNTPKTIEINSLRVLPRNATSDGNVAQFDAVIDGLKLPATITYDNITDLRLQLRNNDNVEVYDSGVISQAGSTDTYR